MRLAGEVGAKVLVGKSDFQLVTGAKSQAATFEKFTLIYVPHEQNKTADLLSKLASTQKGGFNRMIIQETLSRPIIEATEVLCTNKQQSWMDPVVDFLQDDQVSQDHQETKKLIREAI
ncbi:hypothetical protein CR513_62325, partial [Mucuna pruriens]